MIFGSFQTVKVVAIAGQKIGHRLVVKPILFIQGRIEELLQIH